MQVDDVDMVIERMEDVEDDVFHLIEHNPQLIKSDGMLDVLTQLKVARSSLHDARAKLMEVVLAADLPKHGRSIRHS